MRMNSTEERMSAAKASHHTLGIRASARTTRYKSGTARDTVEGASGDGFRVVRSFTNCARDRFNIAADKSSTRATASSACETRAR